MSTKWKDFFPCIMSKSHTFVDRKLQIAQEETSIREKLLASLSVAMDICAVIRRGSNPGGRVDSQHVQGTRSMQQNAGRSATPGSPASATRGRLAFGLTHHVCTYPLRRAFQYFGGFIAAALHITQANKIAHPAVIENLHKWARREHISRASFCSAVRLGRKENKSPSRKNLYKNREGKPTSSQ